MSLIQFRRVLSKNSAGDSRHNSHCMARGLCATAFRQQQPEVKVNVLNVCSPSAEDRKELSAALAKIPAKPTFGKDYEVARGHSTLDPNAPIPGMQQPLPPDTAASADWVRVRREFPASVSFSTVQYSFSVDANNMVETLVMRVRDPKDLMEVAIEDNASSVTSASVMLSVGYTSVAHPAGTLWKTVGGAGALSGGTGEAGAGSERLRTNFQGCVGDSEPLSQCPGRAPDGASGAGSAGSWGSWKNWYGQEKEPLDFRDRLNLT